MSANTQSPPETPSPATNISPEQLAYAGVLDIGMKASLALLIITFGVYCFEMRPPYVPLDKLSTSWNLPATQFVQHNGAPTGWRWVHELGDGDYMNYIGMVFLAGVSAICYLRVLPIFLRKKDIAFAAMALLEIVAIVLAASGIFQPSAH